MFSSKTLFVVGAGASKEAGLPVGEELTDTIANKIVIKFDDGFRQITGDPQITQALRKHVREQDDQSNDINPYLHAGWQIGAAMPQALSIDNYIDTHQHDEKIELCGKLAIIQSILEAENGSQLFFNERQNERINYQTLRETWYDKFMKLLSEDQRKENIDQCFENVSFIVFNYDRCIEHFLYHALQNYYGILPIEAAGLMQRLTIHHPYGVVGHLPWQAGQDRTPFGSTDHGDRLLSLAQQIKTFKEREEDEKSISAIRKLVADAETIVFLGFAFHKRNMELITPNQPCNAKRVFATAKGISGSDSVVIKKKIDEFFGMKPGFEVNLQNRLDCHRLFNEYWRSLSS